MNSTDFFKFLKNFFYKASALLTDGQSIKNNGLVFINLVQGVKYGDVILGWGEGL